MVPLSLLQATHYSLSLQKRNYGTVSVDMYYGTVSISICYVRTEIVVHLTASRWYSGGAECIEGMIKRDIERQS